MVYFLLEDIPDDIRQFGIGAVEEADLLQQMTMNRLFDGLCADQHTDSSEGRREPPQKASPAFPDHQRAAGLGASWRHCVLKRRAVAPFMVQCFVQPFAEFAIGSSQALYLRLIDRDSAVLTRMVHTQDSPD